MVPPYSASLHRLHHPMFKFVLLLVMFVFLFMIASIIIIAPLSLPSPGSLVLSLPHQLDIEMLVWFFELCVAVLFYFLFFLFLSCLQSGLVVPSFCWSITWTHHRTDCANKQQPCPRGTRPCTLRACMQFLVSFFFLFFSLFFFAPFCPFLLFFV